MKIKIVIAITLLLRIVACSSEIPTEDTFGVELIVSPKTIQTFQEIEFEARLINKANHIFVINHAEDATRQKGLISHKCYRLELHFERLL